MNPSVGVVRSLRSAPRLYQLEQVPELVIAAVGPDEVIQVASEAANVLEGEVAVKAGWRELERRVRSAGHAWAGALVQSLVGPGADVLVGSVNDPDLGPVMALGLGGRQAGLAQGVAYHLLPTTDIEADELIDASAGVVAQLEGFRGGVRLDRQALRELILRFALLMREVPEVTEADLNPVRVMTNRCQVLDMRLRIVPRVRPELVKTW